MARPKIIRVGIYTRISTNSEGQKTSHNNQPKYFVNYLNRPDNKGKFKIVATYPECSTGTKLYRKNFDTMLEHAGLIKTDIKIKNIPHPTIPNRTTIHDSVSVIIDNNVEPKFDEIWVKSVSRFARHIGAYDILMVLRANGVIVRFIDDDLTTKDKNTHNTIRDLISAAMYFSENQSKNVKMAKELIKQERTLNSSGLFGYDYHKRSKKRSPYFTINKDEEKVVEYIFTEYAKNEKGFTAMAKHLTDIGYLTRDGKPFCASSLKNMLSNEKYMGKINAGKYTTGDLFEKLPYKAVTDNYEIVDSDDVPQIISEKLWYKCNEIRENRAKEYESSTGVKFRKGVYSSKNPYTALLKCQYCNSKFLYDHNGGKGYYTCATKENKGFSACAVNNVKLTDVEDLIDRLCKGEFFDLFCNDIEDKLITVISLIEKHLEMLKTPTLKPDIEKLEQKVDELEEKVRNGYKLLTRPNANLEIINEIIADDEVELQEALKKLKEISNTPVESKDYIKDMLSNCEKVLKIYNTYKKTYTKDEMMDLIDKIIVFGYRPTTRKYPYKPGLIPVFKAHAKLDALVDFNTPEYTYIIKPTDDDDDKINEAINNTPTPHDIKVKHKTKSHWYKYTTNTNLDNNAYNLDKGYIKDFGVVGVTVMGQIEDKIKDLKREASDIFDIYQ